MTYLAEHLGIPKNNDSVLCPSQGHIQTPRIVQEPNALVIITSDTAEDDVILFSPLESIDTSNFDFLVQLLLERAVQLHERSDIGSLTFIWRNDTDLGRRDARLEKLGDHLFNIGRFGSVQERCSARRDLFGTQVLVEEHGSFGNGPRKVDILSDSLGSGDTVLKRTFVKHVGRELGQAGVHSILNSESNRAVAQDDESFEKRLGKTSSRSLFVHDDRSKLLMVTNEYDLFTSHDQRNHAF